MSLRQCPYCRMFYTDGGTGRPHGCAASPGGPDLTITVRGQDGTAPLVGWWSDVAKVAHFYCDDHQGGCVPVCVSDQECENHTDRAVNLYDDWERIGGPPRSVAWVNMSDTKGKPCDACLRRIKKWPGHDFNHYAMMTPPGEEE